MVGTSVCSRGPRVESSAFATSLGQVGAEEIGSERGFGVFGRFFALPRDTTEQLSFDYITPNVVVGDAAGRSYRLRIAKQPGRV